MPRGSEQDAQRSRQPANGTRSQARFLQNLFRTPSRDASSEEDDAQRPTPGASSGEDSRPTSAKHADRKDSQSWLARRASQKKEKKALRLTSTPTAGSKNEVVGAVEDEWPMYSGSAEDYEMGEAIGYGATSVVRMATFKPLNQVVAVKVMEIEGQSSIQMMQREVQLMSLSKHPNILRVRGDWVTGSHLCIATRFIPPGSLLDIMEFSFRDGLDEVTCATILKQAGEGMRYLHVNGWLHRDIKAGNLLVDEDGTVLISDFGCSSQVFVEGNPAFERNTRKSFVGTPCWMAPEVVEQRPYNSKADVWSFGITAIEIATGRAPHSLYTPAQVLMKTVAENPPTLDLESQANPFSRQFKDMIDSCLKKDPEKRPVAEKLLGHPYFKQAKKKQHLVGALLAGLPRMQDRQTRRSRNSFRLSTKLANTSLWDFDVSPLADQFRGFSMVESTSVPPSPSQSRFSHDGADESTPARTTRKGSAVGSHRRGVSSMIESVPEQDVPEDDWADTASKTSGLPS